MSRPHDMGVVAEDASAWRYMARALKLAERGLYTTDPNPRVGCVVVRDGQVVGEGWHRWAGEPHAEVHALAAAGSRARGAEVYVTLEPCAHFGRTPPCADALIAAGVAKVWVAAADPNPLVAGQGIARLRAAGIAVHEGVLKEQAEALNIGFLRRMREGRPWVRVKTAASLDGRIALANGQSRWITGEAARLDVQRLRARSSAILTGVNTILADDPELTVRSDEVREASGGHIRQPLRVVLDSRLRLQPTLRLFSTGDKRPLIVTTRQAADDQPEALGRLASCADLLVMPGAIELPELLGHLAAHGCNELLVEAGGKVAGAFLGAGLCDEYWVYLAACLLGDMAKPMAVLGDFGRLAEVPRFAVADWRRVGDDLRVVMRPARDEE